MIFCITDIAQLLKKKPNVTDLLTLLADIEYEWHKIGVALEVCESVLESCNRSNEDNSYKLFKVIKAWTTSMTSEVTWEAVIAAVESPIVKHKSTAVKMRMFLTKPEVQFKYAQMCDVSQTSECEVRPKCERMIDVDQTPEHPKSEYMTDVGQVPEPQVRRKSECMRNVEQTSAATKKKCRVL